MLSLERHHGPVPSSERPLVGLAVPETVASSGSHNIGWINVACDENSTNYVAATRQFATDPGLSTMTVRRTKRYVHRTSSATQVHRARILCMRLAVNTKPMLQQVES